MFASGRLRKCIRFARTALTCGQKVELLQPQEFWSRSQYQRWPSLAPLAAASVKTWRWPLGLPQNKLGSCSQQWLWLLLAQFRVSFVATFPSCLHIPGMGLKCCFDGIFAKRAQEKPDVCKKAICVMLLLVEGLQQRKRLNRTTACVRTFGHGLTCLTANLKNVSNLSNTTLTASSAFWLPLLTTYYFNCFCPIWWEEDVLKKVGLPYFKKLKTESCWCQKPHDFFIDLSKVQDRTLLLPSNYCTQFAAQHQSFPFTLGSFGMKGRI